MPGVNAHFNTNTPVFMRPRAVNTAAFNSIIVPMWVLHLQLSRLSVRNIHSIMKMSTEYWQAIALSPRTMHTISWLECVFKIILLMNLSALIAYFYQRLLNLVSVFQRYILKKEEDPLSVRKSRNGADEILFRHFWTSTLISIMTSNRHGMPPPTLQYSLPPR